MDGRPQRERSRFTRPAPNRVWPWILAAMLLSCWQVSTVRAAADPSPSPLFDQSLDESLRRMDRERPVGPVVADEPAGIEGSYDTTTACIYELVCMSGNEDTLAMWELSVGARRTARLCSDDYDCVLYAEIGSGSICLVWQHVGCESTDLPPMPIPFVYRFCDCDSYSTLPGTSTCEGAPTCRSHSCEGSTSCSGGGTMTMCSGGPTCSTSGNPTCDNGGVTCGIVMTCIPVSTCLIGQTCGNAPTCTVETCPGYSTCFAVTCTPNSTCIGVATCLTETCVGFSTCIAPTCPPNPTCGLSNTCNGHPTCPGSATCAGTLGCFLCDCPRKGDINDDGLLNLSDAISLIHYLFGDGPVPPVDSTCAHSDRGDLDCDGRHTILDIVILIDHVLFGSPALCDPCTDQ